MAAKLQCPGKVRALHQVTKSGGRDQIAAGKTGLHAQTLEQGSAASKKFENSDC
jgi:hypothetical protein